MGTLRDAPRRETRMAEYRQTHVVPTEGLPAWAGPDGSAAPAATLDPGLDVMLLEQRAEWAHVRCSNGWEAWVDARRLVVSAPAPATAPTPAPPPPAQAAPPPPAAAPPPPPQTAPTPTTPPPPTSTQAAPPSAAWGTPGAAAPPAGVPRPTPGFEIGAGPIVALVGGLLYFIASWLSWLRFAFLVVVLFLIQTRYIVDALGPAFETGFFSVLRFGAYVAFVGAIGSIVGGILTLVQKRS